MGKLQIEGEKKEHRNSRLSRANKKEAADVCNTKEKEIGLMDSPDMNIHNGRKKKRLKKYRIKKRKEASQLARSPPKCIMYEIIEFPFYGQPGITSIPGN